MRDLPLRGLWVAGNRQPNHGNGQEEHDGQGADASKDPRNLPKCPDMRCACETGEGRVDGTREQILSGQSKGTPVPGPLALYDGGGQCPESDALRDSRLLAEHPTAKGRLGARGR